MKSKEELEALKKEIEDLAKKLSELTEDELKEIGGRAVSPSELTDEQMEAISGGRPNNNGGAIYTGVATGAIATLIINLYGQGGPGVVGMIP